MKHKSMWLAKWVGGNTRFTESLLVSPSTVMKFKRLIKNDYRRRARATAYRLLLAQLSNSVNKVNKSSSHQDDITGIGKPHVKQLSDTY